MGGNVTRFNRFLFQYVLLFTLLQATDLITLSLDWRTCHLRLRRPPCGTTTCAFSFQVWWVKARPYSLCAPPKCRHADISLSKLPALQTLTSARSKSTLLVSRSSCYLIRSQIYQTGQDPNVGNSRVAISSTEVMCQRQFRALPFIKQRASVCAWLPMSDVYWPSIWVLKLCVKINRTVIPR